MKKRWIAAVLAGIFLLLSSCTARGSGTEAGSGTASGAGTDSGGEPGTAEPAGLLICSASKALWRIVYPQDCESTVRQAANGLRTAIGEVTGTSPRCVTDAKANQSEQEILIGEVARTERMEALRGVDLGENDFLITVIGTKIVILGGSDGATVYAVGYFRDKALAMNAETKTVTLAEGYRHIYQASGECIMRTDEANENRITFTLNPDAPTETVCRLLFTGNHGWRLLTAKAGTRDFDMTGASQYLSELLGEEPVQTTEHIRCETSADGTVTATAGDGSRAVLTASPFSVAFYSPAGKELQRLTSIATDAAGSRVSGELTGDEAVVGTGQRMNGVNQRGKRLTLYSLDQWNVIDGNGYVTVPLFLTSRGAGLFVNLNESMTADLGASDSGTWTVDVKKRAMDLYIFTSGSIADAIYGYSALSGFASMPQDWNYGMLVCRYSPEFSDKESVYEMVRRMEENDLPWTGVILEAWDIYNSATYADLKEVVDYLHSLGKKVLAYCRMGVVYTNKVTLPDNRYLLKVKSTGSTQIPEVSADVQNPDAASAKSTHLYLDLTNPDAREWFFGEVWGTLVNSIGIDGAKIDFCELLPDNMSLSFASGKTSGAHHWYPTYFATLFYRMVASKPEGGMVFTRGGGIGSQRNPFLWAGDQRREFSRLQAQLSAVLSSGLSGLPFMSFDMAGYRPAGTAAERAKEKQIFLRGTEMTAFMLCMETHGTVTRPYDFDEETIAIYRAYTKLHEALTPYLRECAELSTRTGMPAVRHLSLGWQDDPNVWSISDEFLLGDGLLVAPVLTDAVSRKVYLPEGDWRELATGEVLHVGAEGMTLEVDVPLSYVPVYLNLNHTSQVLDGLLDTLTETLAGMK